MDIPAIVPPIPVFFDRSKSIGQYPKYSSRFSHFMHCSNGWSIISGIMGFVVKDMKEGEIIKFVTSFLPAPGIDLMKNK